MGAGIFTCEPLARIVPLCAFWHEGESKGAIYVLPSILGLNVYGWATGISYALAIVIGVQLGRRDGRSWRDLVELATVIVLAGVLGAKVFHTLFEARGHVLPDGRVAESLADLLAVDPWHWARLFEPGYVFYGGALFGVGFAYLYLRRAGLERIGAFGDYAAPGFALGIFIGRLGCFAAGCCFGSETSLPWAVQFPMPHASDGAHIHPVQIYDAAFGFLAFCSIVMLYRVRRFPGETFALFCMTYTVWRFVTETFRADADRGLWFGDAISTSQLVSLAVLPLTFWIWRRELRKAEQSVESTNGEAA